MQIALYRLGAREAWQIEAERGSYWYVLDDERVPVAAEPDDAERVERTVLEVAGGIEGQDFEPRPSYEICSWCDYRLICPASRGLSAAELPAPAILASAALAQEALEVLGDRVAGGHVLALELETPSCSASRRATSSSISGLAATARSTWLVEAVDRVLELGGLDGDPGQPLEAAQQRQRRLRVGHRGDVVGDGRPEARRGDPAPRQASWRRRRSRSAPRSWSG